MTVIVFQKMYDKAPSWRMMIVGGEFFKIWAPKEIIGLRYIYDIDQWSSM